MKLKKNKIRYIEKRLDDIVLLVNDLLGRVMKIEEIVKDNYERKKQRELKIIRDIAVANLCNNIEENFGKFFDKNQIKEFFSAINLSFGQYSEIDREIYHQLRKKVITEFEGDGENKSEKK